MFLNNSTSALSAPLFSSLERTFAASLGLSTQLAALMSRALSLASLIKTEVEMPSTPAITRLAFSGSTCLLRLAKVPKAAAPPTPAKEYQLFSILETAPAYFLANAFGLPSPFLLNSFGLIIVCQIGRASCRERV